MTSSTLLRNGNLIGLEPLRIEPLDLLVHDGRVVERGRALSAPPGARVIDCRGRFILPGLVNAHSELDYAQTLGMPHFKGEQNYRDRLDGALRSETVVTAAFSYALDAIRCGTTTLLDLHRSPAEISGSLDLIRDVLGTCGLRAILSYASEGRDDPDQKQEGFQENRRFTRENKNDRVAGLFGLDEVAAFSEEELNDLAEAVQDSSTGLHIVGGKVRGADSGIRALHARGLLGQRTLIAHGVHLDEEETRLLREARAWLIHCPVADARMGLCSAPHENFGEFVALGTAGWPSDMLAEARAAHDQALSRGQNMNAKAAIRMLVGGQQLASELLGVELGSTRRDAGADFVILDYHPRTPIHSDNIAEHLLFGMGARHIDAVMIDGTLCYQRGRFPEIDTRKLAPLIRQGAEQLWGAMAGSNETDAAVEG
ncbi:MAG: amidohydrolase family protein [Planctomycetota bacterium]